MGPYLDPAPNTVCTVQYLGTKDMTAPLAWTAHACERICLINGEGSPNEQQSWRSRSGDGTASAPRTIWISNRVSKHWYAGRHDLLHFVHIVHLATGAGPGLRPAPRTPARRRRRAAGRHGMKRGHDSAAARNDFILARLQKFLFSFPSFSLPWKANLSEFLHSHPAILSLFGSGSWWR